VDFILIYITNPNREEARRIATYLLEKKLVACGNIFPINSLYRWEGEIVDENEFVLIVKTTGANFEKVKNEVEKVHSYECPCIIGIPVIPNEKYSEWLMSQVD